MITQGQIHKHSEHSEWYTIVLNNIGSYHHYHYDYSFNCRDYPKPAWIDHLWGQHPGETERNTSQHDHMYWYGKKTRLDCYSLLVLCPAPTQGQSICSSKHAQGHSGAGGSKKALPAICSVTHTGGRTPARGTCLLPLQALLSFWNLPPNPIYLKSNVLVFLESSWDFLGCPVVRSLCVHCRRQQFNPWSEN